MSIKNTFKAWFQKGEDDNETFLPETENSIFTLKVDNIEIGTLRCENGYWEFRYSESFKSQTEYKLITGFPDIDKVYKDRNLWPFFRIRIPGLKQPAVQEIIKQENLNQENEASLLKRFGKKSISNPYELVW